MLLDRQDIREAENLASSGDYTGALKKYEQVLNRFPELGDEALFAMGLIRVRVGYARGDYRGALDNFQRLTRDYPQSSFRDEAESWTSLITAFINGEQKIKALQKQTETLERKSETLERKTELLEKRIEQMKEIDRSVEAKKRKLLPKK